MDQIKISGLAFWAYHGVLESEQQQGQRFLIDCTYTLDTSVCLDELSRTVHYGELSGKIIDFCQEKSYRLLETLGNDLAAHLLISYPLIDRLTLTIHKPGAPIPHQFSDVCLTLTRSRHIVYLGIGSNLGDRTAFLDLLRREAEADPHIKVRALSGYHETKPYGVTDQPDFLNAVIKLETIYTPMQLLAFCQRTEALAGRVKTRRWGERSLDVDILFYDDLILETEALCVPHADLHRRSFVLAPFCEIDPQFIHPRLGLEMQTLLRHLTASGEEAAP